MAEFTPGLDEQVLEAIRRRIAEEEAQKIAAARGEATARGLTGSTFEAARVGMANKAAMTAQTDAMVNMALERARMAREERMLKEEREYGSAEAQKGREFEADQALLNRIYGADQAEIMRQYQAREAEKEGRRGMVSAGIEGGAGLLGNMLFGSKGGAGGVASKVGALFTKQGASTVGQTFMNPGSATGAGSGLGSALGIGAGLFGGGMAGQHLAKLTGKNTREAKAGSAVGAGIGTAMFGPLGGVAGGALGGLAVKGVQGIAKKAKKIFCFDLATPIEMADGSVKLMGEVELGEETKGGTVESIRVSLSDDLYSYKDILVTGSHAVLEDGEWMRVSDSRSAVPVEGRHIVGSFVTTAHRIFVNGVEFADEHETDDYESLDMNQSLKRLNMQGKAVMLNGK